MRVTASLISLLLLGACTAAPPSAPPSAQPSAPPSERPAPSLSGDVPSPPGPTETTQATSPPDTTMGSFGAALLAAPAVTELVDFTGWAAMRAADGLPARRDQLTHEQRVQFLGEIYTRHAYPAAFAYHKLHSHREAWGWDTLDLEWEAALHFDTTQVHVLRLPDHLSAADIADRYASYGFERRDAGEAIFFSTELDAGSEWLRTTDPAMRNSALIPGQHLLLASTDMDRLEQVVATALGKAPSVADSDALASAIKAVGPLIAGVVLVGDEACSRMGPPAMWPDDGAWVLPMLPELHRYEALILGHRYEHESVLGVIAMAYASRAHAQNDRETRLLLADGPTFSSATGYSFEEVGMDVFFEPREARVTDSTLVMEVVPAADQPRILLGMAYSGEMLFAICGEGGGQQLGRR